jgi:arylsulfatase
LVPLFRGKPEVARDDLWWLHEGNRALRVGDLKVVAAGAESPWELYDLSRDRGEMNDLAGQFPDKVREMAAAWQRRFEELRGLAGASAQ